jgi:hypothetical protein
MCTEMLWSGEALLVTGHEQWFSSNVGKVGICDLPRLGFPVTAVSLEMLQCTDAIVCEDWCVNTSQLAPVL